MSYTYSNLTLPLMPYEPSTETPGTERGALEDLAFPFEDLSEIAELESWRKEVNRPIYHLHKWWAQRLGSVFRGILIAATELDPSRVIPAFYEPTRRSGLVVFDPFMGSGTTIGEALKLGMRGIGRDINHVAYFAVRNALAHHSKDRVVESFHAIERDVAPKLRRYYSARVNGGREVEALYYFWVKWVPCPACDGPVDLFSSYVFSRNAYPKKYPTAQIVCPACGEINEGRYDTTSIICRGCHTEFDPQIGPAQGQQATCSRCAAKFPIAAGVKRLGKPPVDRLYAKMVLLPSGSKAYLRITEDDLARYEQAVHDLAARADAYPVVAIRPGYNTNQVLNYGYQYWHEMFNARQLLSLSILGERVQAIEEEPLRALFTCLFSGVLEFNNMFASFKGEGTGAVRHMFSHHILKPERAPLEANLWGTPKSSGSFSTLFRSRLLRAIEYQALPFEIWPTRANGRLTSEKVYGLSQPMGRSIAPTFATFSGQPDAVYLSCGDSSTTDLPSHSVDLVITDPPFFDNVHYSELADFFHVWQRHLIDRTAVALSESTRSPDEVQSGDAAVFAERLASVFQECHRVLKPDGLMAFTYHHSKPNGWHAVLSAVTRAGLVITAAQPIKSEMAGATPKSQATSPIDIDVILVCRPAEAWHAGDDDADGSYERALEIARDQVIRFASRKRTLSRNDVKVIVMAQLLRVLSWRHAPSQTPESAAALEQRTEAATDELFRASLAAVAREETLA